MWQKAGLKYIVVLLQQLENVPFLKAYVILLEAVYWKQHQYLRIVFIAWPGFLYTLTLHRWAQAHKDLSHVLHSITSALDPSILQSC